MAQYAHLVGRRVDVHYRAGEIRLRATGTLAADSGKSIFLEERLPEQGGVKTFRWEIPYHCVFRIKEVDAKPAIARPARLRAEDSAD